MSETKSLRELGEVYEREAMRIKKIISEKRIALKNLENSICSNEAFEIKRELKSLYSQCKEAEEIADYLKSYYEPHEGKRELFSYK